MKINLQKWKKPVLTIGVLTLLKMLAPSEPLDPWHLLNPQKIVSMVLALAIIQAFGSAIAQSIGTRAGALLTGFLGGLISSTATTASLARRSQDEDFDQDSRGILTFLAATGAMLFEGIALLFIGATETHLANLVIFLGPILATVILIYLHAQKRTADSNSAQETEFSILPILKLAVFILAILTISKVFQNFFGQTGLLVLTFLVSLFEIHGSIIANVQLHELGSISSQWLSNLLAISVLASYLSKLFLIRTLGSNHLNWHALTSTLVIFVSLLLSWLASMGMN